MFYIFVDETMKTYNDTHLYQYCSQYLREKNFIRKRVKKKRNNFMIVDSQRGTMHYDRMNE